MENNFYDQIVNISKASAYDIISQQVIELKDENIKLRNRVRYLEELINEYTLKMKANLSGGKVDEFLKDQLPDSDTEKEVIQEMKDYDDLKDINI